MKKSLFLCDGSNNHVPEIVCPFTRAHFSFYRSFFISLNKIQSLGARGILCIDKPGSKQRLQNHCDRLHVQGLRHLNFHLVFYSLLSFDLRLEVKKVPFAIYLGVGRHSQKHIIMYNPLYYRLYIY